MKRILTILLSLLLLCACQPTPTEEAVVNKGEHSIKDTLSAKDADAYRYDAPEYWNETIEMKNLNIVIDADVVLPDTDRYPIQTIQRHTFTGEDVLTILNACFTGPFELRENQYSMAEVEEDIRMLLRGRVIESDEETGEVTFAPWEEEPEELSELRAQMAECPAEDVFVPLDPALLAYRNAPYVIRTGDGTLLYLSYRKNALEITKGRNGCVQDEHTVYIGGFFGEKWHQSLEHITITEDIAVDTANAALNAAGLDRQFGVGLTEKGRLARAIVDEPYYEVLSEGYILRVSRSGGGYVPFPQGGGMYEEDRKSAMYEPMTEENYAQQWTQDWFELYVSENGIEAVGWYDPNEFVTEANENVVLLPFDEIRNRIRDNLKFSYAWTDERNEGISELHIKKIVLSCAIERIPDTPDEAALVPAWLVVYSNSRGEKVKSHDDLMAINAIDGSYLHIR